MEPKKTVYCNFSFRRPRDDRGYGIFATVFYSDYDCKKQIVRKVARRKLWEDHQYVTAVQSYEYALDNISKLQGKMQEANINRVMLVTDNAILAGWILNHNKNPHYTKYMDRAVKPYAFGGGREIVLGVGLCKPRLYEHSYKYCKAEFINEEVVGVLSGRGMRIKDIVKRDEMLARPKIIGFVEE